MSSFLANQIQTLLTGILHKVGLSFDTGKIPERPNTRRNFDLARDSANITMNGNKTSRSALFSFRTTVIVQTRLAFVVL